MAESWQAGFLLGASEGGALKCSLVLNSLHNSTCAPLIKRVQQIHIVGTDIKVENVGVGGDPLRVIRLGQWYPFLLQRITDQDLLCGLVVSLGDLDESRVVGFIVAHDGGVCFDNDSVLLAECVDRPLLAPWVKLGRISTSYSKERETS